MVPVVLLLIQPYGLDVILACPRNSGLIFRATMTLKWKQTDYPADWTERFMCTQLLFNVWQCCTFRNKDFFSCGLYCLRGRGIRLGVKHGNNHPLPQSFISALSD